jgi:hypothetical protein
MENDRDKLVVILAADPDRACTRDDLMRIEPPDIQPRQDPAPAVAAAPAVDPAQPHHL